MCLLVGWEIRRKPHRRHLWRVHISSAIRMWLGSSGSRLVLLHLCTCASRATKSLSSILLHSTGENLAIGLKLGVLLHLFLAYMFVYLSHLLAYDPLVEFHAIELVYISIDMSLYLSHSSYRIYVPLLVPFTFMRSTCRILCPRPCPYVHFYVPLLIILIITYMSLYLSHLLSCHPLVEFHAIELIYFMNLMILLSDW
jgi:hypothetical protein